MQRRLVHGKLHRYGDREDPSDGRDKKVLCALSGGVDSSVVAVLIHKAIGDQLTCIFVDHGLLRKGEADSVMKTFADGFDMNVIKVDAQDRFLNKLKGVSDPEQNVKSWERIHLCIRR